MNRNFFPLQEKEIPSLRSCDNHHRLVRLRLWLGDHLPSLRWTRSGIMELLRVHGHVNIIMSFTLKTVIRHLPEPGGVSSACAA